MILPLPYQHHQVQISPSSTINLRTASILPITNENFVTVQHSTSNLTFPTTFLASNQDSLNRLTKLPLSDKLIFAQQSLNDLFSDLLSKPLGLSHLGNSSFSFEQLIGDKVKLPRPLNALITSLSTTAHFDSNNNNKEQQINSDANELSLNEDASSHNSMIDNINTRHQYQASINKISAKSSGKKKKNPSLANLVGRCYKSYGCFRISEPFRSIYRPINLIPEPPATIKVSFGLRTRANPSVAERLPYSETSKYLKSQYFNSDHKLKIIVHGYLENGEEYWIKVNALSSLIALSMARCK